MKAVRRQKQKMHKQQPKKDSFSMYFSLLRPAMGVGLFFFIASFIYHYSSVPQQNTTVLGVQTSTSSFWESILAFFASFFR